MQRKIGLLSGVAILMTLVIGTGLFGLPGLAIKIAGPVNSLVGWLAITIYMPFLIIIFNQLGKRNPSSEGIVLMASLGLGPWSKKGFFLILLGGVFFGMPVFFLVGGSYFADFFDWKTNYAPTVTALILLALSSIINWLGVKFLANVNKMILVVMICVLLYLATSNHEIYNAYSLGKAWERNSFDWAIFGQACGLIFWAFLGWENLSFGFGEVENPQKNIPRIYMLGYVLISLIYLGFVGLFTLYHIAGYDVANLSGLSLIFLKGTLGRVIFLLLLLVIIANEVSWVYSISRLYYGAAMNGILPRAFTKLHKDNPAAILFLIFSLCGLTILAIYLFHIPTEVAFLLTNQGFVLLIGGSIYSFTKLKEVRFRYPIALVAFLGWVAVVQSFGWLLIYPLILFVIGCWIAMTQQKKVV